MSINYHTSWFILMLLPTTAIVLEKLVTVKPDVQLLPSLDLKDFVTQGRKEVGQKPAGRYWIAQNAPSTQAHISKESWQRYIHFKEETCRRIVDDDYMAELKLNSTESGYFHWEANEFHRKLRDRLLPQAQGRSLTMIGSHLLSYLDPRLFASEPRSFCEAKRHISEADERHKLVKEEQHMFEDFLINKVLPPDMFAPRRPPPIVPTSSNSTNNGIKL